MSGLRRSPMVRAPALLLLVAVVGGLIGFTWEHATHEATSESDDALEQLPAEDTFELRGEPRRSPEEEAVLQRALSHFPPYPRASRPEVLAVDYLGQNAPIAAVWLTTKDAPDQVLEHYRQVLKERELPVIGQRYNARAGFVGYWSPESGEVFLVSVLAQGGETLLFVSSGRVASLLEGDRPVPEWLPLPPQMEQRAFLSFTLEGTTQHTLSGIVPMRPLEEVADAYQALLASQGWRIGAVHSSEREREFEVRRGQIQGTVSLRRHDAGPEIQLLLSLQEHP
jgi:hypothetical protein